MRRVGQNTNWFRRTHRRQEKPLRFELATTPGPQGKLYGQVRTLRHTTSRYIGTAHTCEELVARLKDEGIYRVQSNEGMLVGFTDDIVEGFGVAQRMSAEERKQGTTVRFVCVREQGRI